MAQHPLLALPAARLRGHGVVLSPRTEVVIEGYPRSANSFAVAAFRLAQGRAVEVAHHTHAPAHVLAAVRRGVPAVVLIRAPEDACVEFLLLRPSLSPAQALRGWIRFYRPLLELRDRVVVGPFPEVTTDFGAVIRRVNERFGTSFAPFEATPDNVALANTGIAAAWATREGPGLPVIGRSPERSGPDEAREGLVRRLRSSPLRSLRSRATDLHASFVTPPRRPAD